MRTNKFIPFFIAILLHAIPVSYFLLKKPVDEPAEIKSQAIQGIDLSGFSLEKRRGQKSKSAAVAKNNLKPIS